MHKRARQKEENQFWPKKCDILRDGRKSSRLLDRRRVPVNCLFLSLYYQSSVAVIGFGSNLESVVVSILDLHFVKAIHSVGKGYIILSVPPGQNILLHKVKTDHIE